MAKKTPNGTWRAVVRVKGRKVSRNFRTRERAVRWAQRVKDGEDPEPRPQAQVPTLAEFFETWFRSFAEVELADSTAASARFLAEKHLLPRVGRLPLEAVDREACLELRAELTKSLAPSYANNVLALARRLFKVARESGHIAASPWDGIRRLKVPPQVFKYWTLVERDTALAWLAKHDLAFGELVTVAVHTGLRWGELYALERRHLDLERAQVIVASNFRPGTKRKVDTTKTGTIGHVPLNEKALTVLKERTNYDLDQAVFDPKLLRAARYRLLAVAKGAKVPALRFHDLRHTFASNLRMAGVDIDKVRQLMRHTSIAMTLRYAHLGADDLSLAAQALCGSSVPDLSPMPPARSARSANLRAISGTSKTGPIVKWRREAAS